MRYLIIFIIFATLKSGSSFGNPIAVDSQRRPAEMIAEEVSVAVAPDASTVSGHYTFRQKADDWPEEPDTHVLIYVPVLLPATRTEDYQKRIGLPLVVYKGRRFNAGLRNDLAYGGTPESVPLPKGWFMQIYEAKIPLPLPDTFQIQVTYTQPNFPTEVVGYVPIRPPQDPNQAKVTFAAPADHAIRPATKGLLSLFSRSHNKLTFSPKHRELLTAQLVKK